MEIQRKLDDIGELLEELAHQYNDVVNESVELKNKIFFMQDDEDGRC